MDLDCGAAWGHGGMKFRAIDIASFKGLLPATFSYRHLMTKNMSCNWRITTDSVSRESRDWGPKVFGHLQKRIRAPFPILNPCSTYVLYFAKTPFLESQWSWDVLERPPRITFWFWLAGRFDHLAACVMLPAFLLCKLGHCWLISPWTNSLFVDDPCNCLFLMGH